MHPIFFIPLSIELNFNYNFPQEHSYAKMVASPPTHEEPEATTEPEEPQVKLI